MSGDLDKALDILTGAGIGKEDARFDIGLIYSFFGDDERLFDEAVKKRADGMPVAYITGVQAFYKEEYKVTPDVLIPRADTELLVESALRFLRALNYPMGDVSKVPESDKTLTSPHILDLCTGTGCVGISVLNSLLEKYPSAEAVLSDVSDAALKVAGENVESACARPENVKVMTLDVLKDEVPEGDFDVITANPPYIDKADMEAIDPQVGSYEPHLALAGGDDGMIFYPHICFIARRSLKEGGALIVEHGYNQGERVFQTLIDQGFNNVKVLKDFGGNDRVTFGIK